MLPEHMRAEAFIRFLSEYNVRYWVNNTVDTKRPVALLDALRHAAIRRGAPPRWPAAGRTRCGAFRGRAPTTE